MHYTINKDWNHPNNAARRKEQRMDGITEYCYVPGHAFATYWVRRIVELQEGDTADNPAATGFYISGPCVVVYETSPDGRISSNTYARASDFYRELNTRPSGASGKFDIGFEDRDHVVAGMRYAAKDIEAMFETIMKDAPSVVKANGLGRARTYLRIAHDIKGQLP